MKQTLIIGLLTFLFACGTSKNIKEENTMLQEPKEMKTNKSIIWVNSYLDQCVANSQASISLLTQENSEANPNNWGCHHKEIEGFNFDPGYICKLSVETVLHEGKPKLKLVEVLSKERDPSYFKLNDIWVLTHFKEKVLEVSENRPNLEVNLSAFKIMGKGMCNNYNANIETYTTSKISFGRYSSTKKMCPDLKMERTYLDALTSAKSYIIKNKHLILYDEAQQILLQFQKVD